MNYAPIEKKQKKEAIYTLTQTSPAGDMESCDVHCFVHRRGSHSNDSATGECNSSADTV
jgi:hypothetical protein